MSALRVAFAGTPEFAVPSLEALAAAGHTLVGVLTQPDRPRGRGLEPSASAVKRAANARGLAIAQPARLASAEERSALERWQPEVLVVVAYGLILPAAVLALPRLGCVNVHASLLPRWRGAAPIQRAILAGDGETGVTIMQMDAGLDTGPILRQESLAIAPQTTSGELSRALALLGARALIPALAELAAGRAQPRPQSADGVTYAPKILKSEALIDFRRDALEIARQVRAFNPAPIAETRFKGEQLRVLAARARPETRADAAPGQILKLEGDALLVCCGQGTLAITELQRAGRRPVSARDFANAGAAPGIVLG